MIISYAISVKDELVEITKLIEFLFQFKRDCDEIVIMVDVNRSDEVEKYLQSIKEKVYVFYNELNGDFASFKNAFFKQCKGDYIFQIDADELPNQYLIEYLPQILEHNKNVDLIYIPRINIVEGITEEDIEKYRWDINEREWINFPDFQSRIYKNIEDIKWINKVHERIVGFKVSSMLPLDEEYCLYHVKTIEKQRKQNEFYDDL